MRLEDVMTRDLPIATPDDGLREAAQMMVGARAKALPVCDGDQLVGIVTDWDVTRACAGDLDLGDLRVADAMSAEPLAAEPRATLDEASEIMCDRGFHHLCVSEDGRYLGMVHLDVDWARFGGAIQAPMATFAARV